MNSLQRWFRRRSARFERLLLICTATLLTLLLLSQLVMLNNGARRFLSRVDFLEGIPYRGPFD